MNMGLSDCSQIIEVDVPRIDAQHKKLFELAATFTDSGDQVRVMKSLAALCDYVKIHFREEEVMMESCAFPGLDAHRKLHEECRKMLVELLGNARSMSLDQVADEVKRLVNGWIYNHILTADFAYVPYLKSVGELEMHGNPEPCACPDPACRA